MISGKQSVIFERKVYVEAMSCVAGKKEGEGPIGSLIDKIIEDPFAGENTWEEAESRLQQETVDELLGKWKGKKDNIRYIFAGDLLGQLIATTFGLIKYDIPLFGLYGACSTFGEAVALGSMAVSAGYAKNVISLASSHFASAEKQFRYPLEYGNQRPQASTWTVTGCGAVMLGTHKSDIYVESITTGKVVDYGVKDSMNMGACMAPAAADLISVHLNDLGRQPEYYDKIITGDLGVVGQKILIDLLKEKGFDISGVHTDCGIEMFDPQKQDTKAGGSGCGCSAVTACSLIKKNMEEGRWKRVLLVPTGALLSTVSFNEGKSIPGIAHGVVFCKTQEE